MEEPPLSTGAGALWRLGVPAALMVAFALVGLAPESWRGDEIPSPRPPGRAATRQALVGATPAPAIQAPSTPAEAQAVGASEPPPEFGWRGERAQTADEPAEPTPRLPSELAPFGPDIVVALQSPSGLPVVLAHTHAADGAPDEARPTTQEAAMAPAGDDVQGPEPGALFWFGPLGLERVRPLGEAPR